MKKLTNEVFLFTRAGLGDAPTELRYALIIKFLALVLESDQLPERIVLYTEGVKLACEGSPVIDLLQKMEGQGVSILLCSTCLNYFGIRDKVKVGVIGGMPEIVESLQKTGKVVSL